MVGVFQLNMQYILFRKMSNLHSQKDHIVIKNCQFYQLDKLQLSISSSCNLIQISFFLFLAAKCLFSASTMYLHVAALIGGGNLTESQTKSFSKDCIIHAFNIDSSP